MAKKQGRVRVTVSIDAEVLEVFRQQAEVLGVSLGRAIGDWCADTADSAQLVLGNIKRAKAAPAQVMRELQDMSRALVKSVDATAKQINEASAAGVRKPHAARGR